METEFAYRIGHFTEQANANVRADNPGRTDAELQEEGLFFEDADMLRWNGIGSADFYIGTEDASIYGVKYGETYLHRLDYVTHQDSSTGIHIDQFVNNDDRWSVDLYRITLRDTGAFVWVVEREDDADSTVQYFGFKEDAYAAFDEECGKDTFGGRA